MKSAQKKGAPAQKKEDVVKKGISFGKTVLERLDLYAEDKFSGNRSAVTDYRFGALFQK